MKLKNRYSIGDISRICNISKKALRYYDEIGIIPSKRNEHNNYRYYTKESLLAIPVVKYYKQMGFTLDEMRFFIEGSDQDVYKKIQDSFLQKIADLKKEQEETHKKYISVKYWYDLVFEAEMVINNNIHEVSIKYVELTDMLYLEQIFDADIKSAIINIEFTNYVESLENEIIGPVVLNFRSHSDRVHNKEQTIRVMQKTLKPCRPEQTAKMGGCMMASCYHIGPHETIHETYEKMHTWMRRHGYVPGADSYERYVTDYWTTRNAAQFVTEIMIQASRR